MAGIDQLKDADLSLDERVPGPSRRLRHACALIVAAVTLLLLAGGAFEPVEHRFTAARAELLDRAPTGEVAIVEIDAKSLAALTTWPWSRRYHAEALRRLDAAGATAVAFDVDFSAHSDPAGDQAFAQALKESDLVILPIFQQRASDGLAQQAVIKTQPAKMFSSAWVGGVNIFAGTDGVVRDYPAATMIGGQIRPSMAALIAENDSFGDRAFEPDWSIDARRIPRFSFVDVLNGRVPADAIAGKRIIIGATAIELGDRYTIPRFGTVPGVVVQALAADSLLQGRATTRTGLLPTLVGVTLVALMLGAGRHRRFNRTFPPVAIAVLAIAVCAPVAIHARWPVSVDSAAILFCAIACIVARVLLEARHRLRLRALIDADTGLPNLRALEDALAGPNDPAFILAAAAIERFDSIRNAIGTEAAGELVREVAARIETVTGTAVYHIAPDTVAWLEAEGRFSAGSPAERELAGLFRDPVETREGRVDVLLTVGLDGGAHEAPRIERALAAISSARSAGQTCHRYQGSDPAVRRQLSLMGDLRRGMAAGEVTMAYQPKLDLRADKITQAEALVRWRHPVEGMIPPDQFVPLAEATGVIRELTDFVLGQALGDCVRLERLGKELSVAVNVSAADLGRDGFVDQIAEVIANTGVNPSRLTLEVTESAIFSSPETAIRVLTALRERNVTLSIDDYGTGQSTLSYLKQLPVHELKIDKSFVSAMCENENDRIMVRSTINMAHELGLGVVAEGVEDAPTLELLRSFGCDYAQGYFISRAMPFEQLCATIDEDRQVRKVA